MEQTNQRWPERWDKLTEDNGTAVSQNKHRIRRLALTFDEPDFLADIRESRVQLTNRLIKSYPQECMREMRK